MKALLISVLSMAAIYGCATTRQVTNAVYNPGTLTISFDVAGSRYVENGAPTQATERVAIQYCSIFSNMYLEGFIEQEQLGFTNQGELWRFVYQCALR